jgi:hypothetical protein
VQRGPENLRKPDQSISSFIRHLVKDNLAVDPEGNSYASGQSTLNPQGASERGAPERQISP